MYSKEVEYQVVYSGRKTVSISIDGKGTVTVRAPYSVNAWEIKRIVKEKNDWIQKKLAVIQNKSENAYHSINTEFCEQSLMRYLGNQYPIHLSEHQGLKKTLVSFDGIVFLVRYGLFDSKTIRQAFIHWYKQQAKEVYWERINYYQKILKEPMGNVRIKDQKSCFGSCSSKRNLNFNFRCVLAPLEVLDYIVVHELCHLRHMNHSAKFWKEVETILPQYKDQKRWLKENSVMLEL